MSEPTWLHLAPINDAATMPHQPSRGCWCGPQFAIDVRPTAGRDDVRVLLHRATGTAQLEEFIALRARKGEIVAIP